MAKLALILGGARSGKSVFAEGLAQQEAAENALRKIYIATCHSEWDGVVDPELRARIDLHQRRRGEEWETIEAPDALEEALTQADGEGAVVLVDCMTLWLTNRLLEAPDGADDDVSAAQAKLLSCLATLRGPTILVSSEVGMGLTPETALGRRFRDAQGRLNQLVAQQADLAVFVAAGLPLTLKGDLREWSA